MATEYPTLAEKYPSWEILNIQAARFIRMLALGRLNNVLDVTLTANAATTTVTDGRISSTSVPICVPTSANAAAIDMPWVDQTTVVNGSLVLNHANDADVDKTFKVILIG
jgi:hypothetical protein|tara:strand:- start:181 stop:510 length:330 start_codon:yes stop_codon:yes gene_type:complete